MATPEEINGLLEELNPRIFGVNSRLVLEYVDFEELTEQDINANVMEPDMFNALVGNIRKNGQLESIPLVANEDGDERRQIVSGHHRIRSAREAGLKSGIVLRYKDLTKSEIRAKQLAHNSIAGKSDNQIVAEIFRRIDGLDLQMEAYIDTKSLMSVPDPVSFKPVDLDPMAHAKTVTIVFLPTQATDFRTAMDLLTSKPDAVYVANREAFEGFKDAVHQTRKDLDIHSIPSAVAEMSRMVISALSARNAIEVEQNGQE